MDEAKIDIEELIKENESLKEQLENSSRMFYDMVKKTNQHLKDLFDNSNDLIQIIKPSGELRFVNQAWKYKMGYNDDQIVDLDFIDLIHPDRKKETNEKLEAASISPLSERFSTILVSKLGKNIYVNGNLTSVFEEGKLVEFRCIFYDVTERMRAESAQSLYFTIASHTSREQNIEEFFESIYSELNLHLRVRNFAIAIYNNDQLEFPLYINEKLSSKEVSDVDYLLTEYTVERKKPVIIYEEGVHKIEEQYHRKISGKLPKIWMGVPFYTTNSKGAMMMYSYRDHTTFNNKDLELLDFISSQVGLAIQRKQSDEKIIDQAARLEAIIESSTHHIWSINREYEFTSFNENYALFFIACFPGFLGCRF
jgi:hypothetical protein